MTFASSTRNGLVSSSPSSTRSSTKMLVTVTFLQPPLKSSVKLLTASIRVDWFSLPKFLDRMLQLRQGLVKKVFQTKAFSS